MNEQLDNTNVEPPDDDHTQRNVGGIHLDFSSEQKLKSFPLNLDAVRNPPADPNQTQSI